MAQARGHEHALTLFEESTYATDPGSPSGQVIHVVTNGLRGNAGKQPDNSLGNRVQKKPAPGNKDVGGPLTMYVCAKSLGTLFKHIFGAVATTGTDPYTHEYTPGDLPVGLVLEKDLGGSVDSAARYEKFNGERIQSMNLTLPTEGWPMLNLETIGAKRAFGSSALDDTPTDNGYAPFHAHESSLQEGGSDIAIVTNGNIQLANNLETGNYVVGGDGERVSAPEGFAVITGQITALFEDKSLLDKAINDTSSSLKFTLSRGTGDGSDGNEFFELEVQDLVYEPASPEISGPAGVMQTLNFHGHLDSAESNSGLIATIKNAVATV